LLGAVALGLHGGGASASDQAGCSPAALASEVPPAELHGLDPSFTGETLWESEADAPTHLAVAHTAAGTFMGVRDDLLTAPITAGNPTRVKFNRGGTSVSFRLDFDDGARAAFKPEQTNLQTVPRYEIAAYRLNRLLGLNRVAPAVPLTVPYQDLVSELVPDSVPLLPRVDAEVIRQKNGLVHGEASYWIPVIRDIGLDTPSGIARWAAWLKAGQPIPDEDRSLAEQISTMLAFDLLTDNIDRFSGGNILADETGTRLYYMDNTLAFGPEPTGHIRCRHYLAMTERFSRSFYQALQALDEPSLRAAMAADPRPDSPLLTDGEIRAVLARRQFLIGYIAGLIDVFGEQEVLAFP
jgi:hypothetical protein